MIRLSFRRFAGGAAKPHWGEPPKNRWQPFLLDRTHYGEHPTYNGFVLLLRALRPKIEQICHSTFNGISSIVLSLYNPLRNIVVRHNPDIRYQLVALISFALTSRAITAYFGDVYQKIVDVNNMLLLGLADDLNEQGFWNSKQEDNNERLKYFHSEQDRLNKLWTKAIDKATRTQSFDDLCSYVIPKPDEVCSGVIPPVSWRFNLIPYGKDNADTVTFDIPSHDQPLRSLALNFTYNNLSGDWGDYINRQDNKNPLVRPSRQMFTDVYIPGTK